MNLKSSKRLRNAFAAVTALATCTSVVVSTPVAQAGDVSHFYAWPKQMTITGYTPSGVQVKVDSATDPSYKYAVCAYDIADTSDQGSITLISNLSKAFPNSQNGAVANFGISQIQNGTAIVDLPAGLKRETKTEFPKAAVGDYSTKVYCGLVKFDTSNGNIPDDLYDSKLQNGYDVYFQTAGYVQQPDASLVKRGQLFTITMPGTQQDTISITSNQTSGRWGYAITPAGVTPTAVEVNEIQPAETVSDIAVNSGDQVHTYYLQPTSTSTPLYQEVGVTSVVGAPTVTAQAGGFLVDPIMGGKTVCQKSGGNPQLVSDNVITTSADELACQYSTLYDGQTSAVEWSTPFVNSKQLEIVLPKITSFILTPDEKLVAQTDQPLQTGQVLKFVDVDLNGMLQAIPDDEQRSFTYDLSSRENNGTKFRAQIWQDGKLLDSKELVIGVSGEPSGEDGGGQSSKPGSINITNISWLASDGTKLNTPVVQFQRNSSVLNINLADAYTVVQQKDSNSSATVLTWNQHLLEIGSVGNALSLPLFTVDDKLIDALKRQDVAGLYASSAGLLGLNLLNLDNPGVIDATVLQSKDKTLIPMPILGKATSEPFNDSEQKITVTNSSPYAAQARCRAVDGGIWVTSPVAANSSANLFVNVPEGVATECQLTGTAAGGTDITALQTPVVAVTAAETTGTGTDLPIATWKNLLQKLVVEANEVINSEDYNKYSLESRTVLNTTTEYASALLQDRFAESAEYTAAYIRLDNALKTLKLAPTDPKPTEQPGGTTSEPKPTEQPGGTTSEPKPTEQPGGTTSEPKPTEQPGVTTAEPKPTEQPGGTTSEPKPTEQPGGEVDALRKELRELIERYTETNSKDTYVYADETVKAELDALIRQAKELAEKDNVTPEELKALISKINTAFASLNGNRNQLVKEIERIEKITSSTQFINADSELKEQLAKLLEEAKTAVKDGSITEEQLLKLLAQLNSVLASINATSNTDSPTSENPTSATPTTQSPEPTQTEPAATPEKSNPLKWLLLIPVLLALGLGGSYAVYLNQVAGGDRAPLQPGQANFADFVRWLQNLPPRP